LSLAVGPSLVVFSITCIVRQQSTLTSMASLVLLCVWALICFQEEKTGVDLHSDVATTRINSISFHRTEDLLVSASNDDVIRIYDTQRAKELNTLQSKKYGVANICYTHDPQSVVYSSTKGSHAWRYHDLHANRYLKYFSGHAGRVTALHVSPKTDSVLSASEDKQVRLWDLRSGQCQAVLHAPGIPTCAWDEQGLVFCVAAESGIVKLYDARYYSSGPFTSFEVAEERNSNALFSVVRFSLDGNTLMAVVEGRIYVLDAFDGKTICTVKTGVPEGGQSLEATLTPDGKFILSGCNDRHIRVWNSRSGEEVAVWPQHADVPACTKFSPRKLLVASASQELALWIPS
jgi:COMPASS component SWD2